MNVFVNRFKFYPQFFITFQINEIQINQQDKDSKRRP